MRLQGLDFKAEVDRRVEQVMVAVESQMGYVPEAVERHLFYTQILKVRRRGVCGGGWLLFGLLFVFVNLLLNHHCRC